MEPLLRVRDLKTYFVTEQGGGTARAVDGVSFELYPGETLGLVGESGCGKTVTSLSVLRLIPEPPGHIRPGSFIEFEGRNLLALEPRELRAIRGNRIAMIFQEPMTSLNPVFTVGDQIAEAAIVHQGLSRRAARARAIEMLTLVGIPDPGERVDHYPHQMSGGMRQRVMIAMALVCHPQLLIADEPTTALDVTIQAQILELLDRLQAELGMAVMLITHDLGLVAGSADRVVVMYAGQVVEQAPTVALFARPLHPYTEGLLASVPRLDAPRAGARAKLHTIPGQVPAATAWPPGCRFHPRCPYAWERCRRDEPPLLDAGSGDPGTHTVRCWLLTELGMAIMLITHDLGLVAGSADRVVVMYAGQVVEQAPTVALFARPLHPYTEGLLASVPRLDAPRAGVRAKLHTIPGQVPAATAWPPGCRFHPRCPYAWERCRRDEPPLLDAGSGDPGTHTVRCWLLTEPRRRIPHA